MKLDEKRVRELVSSRLLVYATAANDLMANQLLQIACRVERGERVQPSSYLTDAILMTACDMCGSAFDDGYRLILKMITQ